MNCAGLFADKLPQHTVLGHQLGAKRRERRKFFPQGGQLACLGGGQRRVCRHGVQYGTPQADLVGMGRVQQEIGAGLVGLDIAVLARADVAPQPQRERCAVKTD